VRERLSERLRMLTAGSRIALRRHQTLRAALDWSHALLAEQDQVVFRRLGVFSGGCTIEAAQQVAGDEQLDEWTVLDAIGRLVDKSLIVADGEDKPRYRMLESARAYALEKLAAAQETDALARRHAACYAGYVERIREELFAVGGTEDGFIGARTVEFDNFRAALKWSLCDKGDAGLALALLADASPLALVAASRAESDAWLLALRERLANVELTPRQGALHCAAEIAWSYMTTWVGSAGLDGRGSWPIVRRTLRPLGDRWTAYCGCMWALLDAWRGDVEAARAVLDEVRVLEDPDWPVWLPAYRLTNSIRFCHMAGEPSTEIGELPTMLARLQRDGDDAGRAACTIGTLLAEVSLLQGRFDESAQRLLALSEQGRQQRRDAMRMMQVFRPLILALTEIDRLDEARAVVAEAMPLVHRFDWRGVYAPALALLAARRGHPETAARLLAAGEARRSSVGGRLQFVERYAERRACELLAGVCDDNRLSTWRLEGVALSDDEFDRLVIAET
jgi:hypothetical protein